MDDRTSGDGAGRTVRLHLFNGPYLTMEGVRTDPPDGSKRLLALLGVPGERSTRDQIAHELWPDVPRQRADGNLRTALWRLHRAGLDLVESDADSLALHPRVVVDVSVVEEWATRVVTGLTRHGDLQLTPSMEEALCVLPGWYDDWVILARERLRTRMLRALEALSRRLHQAGRFAESVEAALVAVSADPFRETAQQALIESHLAEGNLIEAHRVREAYRELLDRELGVPLSPLMGSMISGSGSTHSARLALVHC